MEHLIANSGIQFMTTMLEFNPSEPLLLPGGRQLKYTFCEIFDTIYNKRTFDFLFENEKDGTFVPIDELREGRALILRPSGREELDDRGVAKMKPETNTILYTCLPDGDEQVFSVNNLESFRVRDPETRTVTSGFELLLDRWLPMPMFRKEVDGTTSGAPMAWCRMRMELVGPTAKKGVNRYRLIWAFDTQTSDDEFGVMRPFIYEEEGGEAEYTLCNRADMMLEFLSSSPQFHAFSQYIGGILKQDPAESSRFKGFFIYFVNFIRLKGGAPEIMLHLCADPKKFVPVDLVLDIGNSRTCGILFEQSDFRKATMLELVNLTHPNEYYENKTYDMRVVFRKADFGNDIVLDEDMFQWRSFVRIGDEASRLVHRSIEEEGLAETTTNYSSPKRYLWDLKKFPDLWQNLVTTDDPYNLQQSDDIYIPGLSDLFNADGSYNNGNSQGLPSLTESHHHYSRSSLMTFAFIEIFQHALTQINSPRYHTKWRLGDVRRVLRNVIITCPTAMPLREQLILRQHAIDAMDAIVRTTPGLQAPHIIPEPEKLRVTDDYADPSKRVWCYDEASCCQLTYLYAEINENYKGEIHKFIELKGHVRPDLKEDGYEGKSLTIGTIDIGAGTTDVMICAYECEGQGRARLSPVPLFWDSFYLAGDDILRNLIQNLIIEGDDLGDPNLGNITSALTARIMAMDDAALLALPCNSDMVIHDMIVEITENIDPDIRKRRKEALAAELINAFFGRDSHRKDFNARRCRTDFNTQVSVPIAQMLLDLLRKRRPTKLYSFDEIFTDIKPADYLMEHFANHFGFRFEELSWRFDPETVAGVVKATMEPLMKQLALVLYAQRCDIIVLAGRPTSLDAITELFIKYIPTDPSRLIRLNNYHVGDWFPTADSRGYFYDQKSIVAAGAMVGYLASHNGLPGLVIDFTKMIKRMKSTAFYIGPYNSQRQQVTESALTPEKSTATFNFSVFPAFIGCRQLDSLQYQGRPLYAIYDRSGRGTLQISISRNYHESREQLTLDDVTDREGNTVPKQQVELVMQTLVDDGKYWLDKGEFELTIKRNI